MNIWYYIVLVLIALNVSSYPYGIVPRWYPNGTYATHESTVWLLWDLYHVAVAGDPLSSAIARSLGERLATAYWHIASVDDVFYERIELYPTPHAMGPRGWRVGYQVIPWFNHELWDEYVERLVRAYPVYGEPVFNPYPGSPIPPYTGMGLERVVAPYAALTNDRGVVCRYLESTAKLIYEAGGGTWIPGDPSRQPHMFYSDISDTIAFLVIGADIYGCRVVDEYARNFTLKVYELFNDTIPAEYDIDENASIGGLRFHVLYFWVLLYDRYIGREAALSLAANYDRAMERGELSAYDAAYAAWMYMVLGYDDRAEEFVEYAFQRFTDNYGVIHNDGVGGWHTPCGRTWVAGIMLSSAVSVARRLGLPSHEILAWGGVDTPWTPYFNGAWHETTRVIGDKYIVVFNGVGEHVYYIPLPPWLDADDINTTDTLIGRIAAIRARAPCTIVFGNDGVYVSNTVQQTGNTRDFLVIVSIISRILRILLSEPKYYCTMP